MKKKIIGSFYDTEPDSHIRDKVKIVLHLSNYDTKKELKKLLRALIDLN